MIDQTMAYHQHRHHHHREPRRINLSRVIDATKRFPCEEPQLRAYNLRDLVYGLQPSESANQPVYIVLKRCDSHAGCCVSPDLSCAPVQSSIYYEEMEIEIWSLLTNSTMKIWIKVEQHGRCSCEISSTSERLRDDVLPPKIEMLWYFRAVDLAARQDGRLGLSIIGTSLQTMWYRIVQTVNWSVKWD